LNVKQVESDNWHNPFELKNEPTEHWMQVRPLNYLHKGSLAYYCAIIHLEPEILYPSKHVVQAPLSAFDVLHKGSTV